MMWLVRINPTWMKTLLIVAILVVVDGDMFHYYKLKKFLTAVAFARALGKRPTVLPIPIPIPIPIQQNEVIKIPAQSGKTIVAIPSSDNDQKHAQVISGGNVLSSLGKVYTGSTNFGYSLPSVRSLGGNVIDLSSLTGHNTNNVISLSSLTGSGSNPIGGITIVDDSALNLLNGGGIQNIGLGTNGIQTILPSSILSSNGIGLPFDGDLNGALSTNSRGNFQFPLNFYKARKRRKRPFISGGRRMRSTNVIDPNINDKKPLKHEPYPPPNINNQRTNPVNESLKITVSIGDKLAY